MIERSDAPGIAALVACPARSEWPAYRAASGPALVASFLTIRATSTPESRLSWMEPCRVIGRNSAPAVIPCGDIRCHGSQKGRVSLADRQLAGKSRSLPRHGFPVLRAVAAWWCVRFNGLL